jgi:HK97 family phage portal protein
MFLSRRKARSFEETIAMLDSSGGATTDSGVYVNSDTAMRQSTVYACVRILSEIIAQLPVEVQMRRNGSWIAVEDHDILRLLASPNDWQVQHDMLATITSWSELRGNAYQFKIRNGKGAVAQLIPLQATEVEVCVERDRSLTYTVSSEYTGITGEYKADRIFHLRNFGTQGYMGLSTIGCHKEGIGLALSLEKHASNAYKNGMQSNKWIKLERSLEEPQLSEFKASVAKYQGQTSAGKMPFLSEGEIREFKGVSAVDAQYIESRKFSKEDISSIFQVPLFLLNDGQNTTWGSGLEQISRSFVRFSLNPRLNRIAQTLVREFVEERARHRTRIVFDTDQFTLGEFKDRMDGYRAAIESGVLNPNECRDIEKRNPRDGGDDYRIPANIMNEGDSHESQDDTQPATD